MFLIFDDDVKEIDFYSIDLFVLYLWVYHQNVHFVPSSWSEDGGQ